MGLNLSKPIPPPEPVKAETPKPEPVKQEKGKKAEVPTTLADVLKAVRKSKGEKIAVVGNAIPAVRRLPTGIFELDFYLGGGFPRGRYSIVYGPESSCKTNAALKAAAQAQKLPAPCNKVVWVDLEQQFDPIWAAKMGVDTTKIIVMKPGYGEEACDLVDAVVRADDVALVVVDSVAAMIASKEIGQSMENFDIGTSAMMIKRMVNKLMVAFSDAQKKGHEPCVILINQTRFKPGVMFGDPETMPGGEAQKFLSTLRVRFNGKNVIDKNTSTVHFKDVHVVVKKAKVPIRAVAFDFSLCMHPHDDLQIGETDSFNMVKGNLMALGLLAKVPQGYQLKLKPSLTFPTLTAIQDRYQKEQVFQRSMQQLVLDNYAESMITVDESAPNPNIAPGEATAVQSVAEEE